VEGAKRQERQKAQRPTATGQRAKGPTNETSQTELNWNGSARSGPSEKDCADQVEKLPPTIYKA